MDINISSQLVVKTEADWALDTTVYSEKRILISSDAVYSGTDQRKFKIPNGVDTWSNLDYLPIGEVTNTITINGLEKSLFTNPEFRVAQASTGALTYTGVVIDSSTTVSIGAVDGYVIDNESDPNMPSFTKVTYPGENNKTVTTIGSGVISYILLQPDGFGGGNIVFQNTFPTSAQRKTSIYLSKVSHPNLTSLAFAADEVDFMTSPVSQFRDLFQAFNYVNRDVYPSANGSNLQFNLSTGTITGDGINFVTDNTNPNTYTVSAQTPSSFIYRNQTGGNSGFVSAIDPANYDNGGTTTAIGGGANSSTIQYIFYVPPLGLIVQRGQFVYSSLSNAIANVGKENFNVWTSLVRNSILIGVLAVKKNATDLSDTSQAQFFKADVLGQIIGSAGGTSTGTLQTAYNNSSEPEILTDSTRGSVTIKRGSAADTDTILEGLNGAGTSIFSVKGSGQTSIGAGTPAARLHVSNNVGGINSGVKIEMTSNDPAPTESYSGIAFQTTAGLIGQFVLTAPNYSSTVDLSSNALALISQGTSLDLISVGYLKFNSGGYGIGTERMRLTANGELQMSHAINEAKGANIASAATTDIGAATGNLVHITGTTTITSLGTVQAGTRREVVFDGALTLTHNATSLILPGGYNIVTASGDVATFLSEGSGNWRLESYLPANSTTSKLISPSSDQNITSTTAVDLTGLVFPVQANKKYLIRGATRIGCDGAGGHKLAVSIPSGATMWIDVQGRIGTNDTQRHAQITSSGVLTGALCPTTSAGSQCIWYGTITISSTAGNVQIQGATVTGGQTSTLYSEGSCLELIPL